jgi:DNA-directed RNA polymerase subunit N
MIIPIRCFTCGKPIGHLWETYQNEVKKGANPKDVLDRLGLDRYCCRAIFLTHLDLMHRVGRFKR